MVALEAECLECCCTCDCCVELCRVPFSLFLLLISSSNEASTTVRNTNEELPLYNCVFICLLTHNIPLYNNTKDLVENKACTFRDIMASKNTLVKVSHSIWLTEIYIDEHQD